MGVFFGVAAASLVVALVTAGLATDRLPFLTHAWATAASAVEDSLTLSAPRPSRSAGAAPPSMAPSGYAGTGVRHQSAPLSSAQLGAPLIHGSFVGACGAPDEMKVVVHATVKKGRAVDVTVKTEPESSTVASCIARATRDLQWDISPKTAHVTVTY